MTRKERARRAEAARKGWRTRRRHERALELERIRKAEERAARRRAREREEARQAAARREAAKKAAATRKRNARKADRERQRALEEKAKEQTRLEREQRKREREIDQEQIDREDRKAKGELPETWDHGDREKITRAEKTELSKALYKLLELRERNATREKIQEAWREWRSKKDPLRAALTMAAWEKLMHELGRELALDLHGPDSVWSYILS